MSTRRSTRNSVAQNPPPTAPVASDPSFNPQAGFTSLLSNQQSFQQQQQQQQQQQFLNHPSTSYNPPPQRNAIDDSSEDEIILRPPQFASNQSHLHHHQQQHHQHQQLSPHNSFHNAQTHYIPQSQSFRRPRGRPRKDQSPNHSQNDPNAPNSTFQPTYSSSFDPNFANYPDPNASSFRTANASFYNADNDNSPNSAHFPNNPADSTYDPSNSPNPHSNNPHQHQQQQRQNQQQSSRPNRSKGRSKYDEDESYEEIDDLDDDDDDDDSEESFTDEEESSSSSWETGGRSRSTRKAPSRQSRSRGGAPRGLATGSRTSSRISSHPGGHTRQNQAQGGADNASNQDDGHGGYHRPTRRTNTASKYRGDQSDEDDESNQRSQYHQSTGDRPTRSVSTRRSAQTHDSSHNSTHGGHSSSNSNPISFTTTRTRSGAKPSNARNRYNNANNVAYDSDTTTDSDDSSNSDTSSTSDSDLSNFHDEAIDSDEYDEYMKMLQKSKKEFYEPNSDDEQMIFRKINPTDFSAYPSIPPSSVNLLSEAVQNILSTSHKDAFVQNSAETLLAAGAGIDGAFSQQQAGVGRDGKTVLDLSKLTPEQRDLVQKEQANLAILKQWGQIGGHKDHIKVLHEMIILPLLYPSLFHQFNISPPRGVLFTGSPGTGKTLTARTLANIVQNVSGKKVHFFVRKGADCLSKWVGEAERQLRLLFEQAKALQPSIIFFDEIDGLAPVRNSNQDHVHSSIVSTLLALMDGLDGRGDEVIVIGATNRVDSIDPALRRPGRFDRELTFTLPTYTERIDILHIHTKQWKQSFHSTPSDPFARSNQHMTEKVASTDPLQDDKSAAFQTLLEQIAGITAGYSGADLQSLTTQASLCCLRRCFPQLYGGDVEGLNASNNQNSHFAQLLTQSSTNPAHIAELVKSIVITHEDFVNAMKAIVPTQQRVLSKSSKPLNSTLQLLYDTKTTSTLQHTLCDCCKLCNHHDEVGASISFLQDDDGSHSSQSLSLFDQLSTLMHRSLPIPETTHKSQQTAQHHSTTSQSLSTPSKHSSHDRYDKLFLLNQKNLGQNQLTQALLTKYEELPIFTLSLASLHTLQQNYGTTTLHDTVLTLFTSIRRDFFTSATIQSNSPQCIIYWPNLHQWFEFAYLHDLIELILLSLQDLTALSSQQSSEATITTSTSLSTASSRFFLLCDAEWDFFDVPQDIMGLFNHTSSQGLIIDISHNRFHNLLLYPLTSFPLQTDPSQQHTSPLTTPTSTSSTSSTSNTAQPLQVINDTSRKQMNQLISLLQQFSQGVKSKKSAPPSFDPFSSLFADSLQHSDSDLPTFDDNTNQLATPRHSSCVCTCSNRSFRWIQSIINTSLQRFFNLFVQQHTKLALHNGNNLCSLTQSTDVVHGIKRTLAEDTTLLAPDAPADVEAAQTAKKSTPKKRAKKGGRQRKGVSDNDQASVHPVSDQSMNDSVDLDADLHENVLVQLPPSSSLIPIQATVQAVRQIVEDTTPELDLTDPDEIYTAMKEQRYREILLLHLRIFLRSVHSHLIAHFKDFVLPRHDMPDLMTSAFNINPNRLTQITSKSTNVLSQRLLNLSDMLTKINSTGYLSIREYLFDIDLIVSQTKLRFPLATAIGRALVQRVCQLQDVALTLCFGFDVQVATACELIASSIRNRQSQQPTSQQTNIEDDQNEFDQSSPSPSTTTTQIDQQTVPLPNSITFTPPPTRPEQLFQFPSLLMTSDLRAHVRTYIKNETERRLLKLQSQQLGKFQQKYGHTEHSDGLMQSQSHTIEDITTTSMAGSIEPQTQFTSDLNYSQPSPSLVDEDLLGRSILAIEKKMTQLSVFTAFIDVPTLQSFHNQLLHCLSSTTSVNALVSEDDETEMQQQIFTNVVLSMTRVIDRFLLFCCRTDEMRYQGYYTGQLQKLIATQSANLPK